MILAMPNTNPPTVDEAAFALTHKLARNGARCDYAVYVGASSDNYSTLPQIGDKAAGLKMYLNETFTTLKLDDISVWMKVGMKYLLFLDIYVFFKVHHNLLLDTVLVKQPCYMYIQTKI